MMVNEKIVGPGGVNFITSNSPVGTSGNVANGNWYKQATAVAKAKHGPDVEVLMFILCHDKTLMTKNCSSWPMIASSGNFKTSLLASDSGNKLIGFVPDLPCNEERLRKYLRNAGVTTKKNLKSCITMTHSYYEQMYLLHVLLPILECQDYGPIWLRLGGRDNYTIKPYIPEIVFFVGKY
jgi:hypothetical protein